MYNKILKVYQYNSHRINNIVIVYPKMYTILTHSVNAATSFRMHKIGPNQQCRRPRTIFNRCIEYGYTEYTNAPELDG